jgi:molybdopterin/thiamine biosynthesis adenylyltransferase/rhodanese-related sulfurtransferase
MDIDKSTLSQAEFSRYSRHIMISEIGLEGQLKIKNARVLVIGAGGLGAPLLQYLAAAGIGTIGIVDDDLVEDSNLQRQVLFGVSDIGQPKVIAAKNRLEALNPHINIIPYQERLTSRNAYSIFGQFDFVADGSDNFATRYLVNDAAYFTKIPNIFGSIYQFEGQISVFNFRKEDGEISANYRDLFPTPPLPGTVPSCGEAGVLGVLPGIIGALQANEVLKLIVGIGEPLVEKLMSFNALSGRSQLFSYTKNENNPISGKNPSISELIDYEVFCNNKPIIGEKNYKMDIGEFERMRLSNGVYQLIDIREPNEHQFVSIGGINIPLKKLETSLHLMAKNEPLILYCKSGKRCELAIELLGKNGFLNVKYMEGGILSYIRKYRPDLPIY